MHPKFSALKQDLTGSTVTTFSPSLCVAGATYTFKVQAVFGASGSLLSRPSSAISVPVTVSHPTTPGCKKCWVVCHLL